MEMRYIAVRRRKRRTLKGAWGALAWVSFLLVLGIGGGVERDTIALGAGFVDALGYGSNTKAALIRIGLMEMKKFTKMFYKGVKNTTFFQSSGVADLITTCWGGRNVKCATLFAQTGKVGEGGAVERSRGRSWSARC